MKRVAAAVLVGLGCLSVLIGPALLALVAVLFGASANATTNPCMSPIGTVTPVGGPVRLPVVGRFQVTSEYGMRSNPGSIDHGQYRLHAGLDLAEQPAPSTVVAVMAGVVQSTPTSTGGGHQVVIDHGGGVLTGYKHLTSRTVQVGDKVWPGRPIGVEGTGGNSTGPHLHFEVTVNGRPVNPRAWLTRKGVKVPALGATGTAPSADPAVGDAGTTSPTIAPGYDFLKPAPLAPTGPPGKTKPVVADFPTKVGRSGSTQVVNAGYIIKAGQARGLDAKTITIAVMTAMAESSLTNLHHGDAVRNDTIGLFQEGPERGPLDQRMDPSGAANIFYDHLLRVKNYLDLEPTIAAHRAQANADPYHYRSQWAGAVQMVSTLTADPSLLQTLPAIGPIGGCGNEAPGELPPAGSGSGSEILASAEHYLGTPYSWGGGDAQGPSLGIYQSASLDGSHTVGFDCSGLVLFAVNRATGILLPHDAEAQGKDAHGQTIPRAWSKMRPGDVISFSEDGSGAPGSFGHVGIYAGAGKMIHAPRPGKNVEVIQLKGSSYFEPMAWSIKRYAN